VHLTASLDTDVQLDDILFATLRQPAESDITLANATGLRHMSIDFGGEPLLVLSPYSFFSEIRDAKSPKSLAKYLLWKEDKERRLGFLVQYIPPNAITSRHYHNIQTEVFNVIEGSVFLEAASSLVLLKPGSRRSVAPETIHRLSTGHEPSLTVIEMQNYDGKSSKGINDHYFVD
jgi:mannose-6-phosphate isomerase-like protein (cupin superfamily)